MRVNSYTDISRSFYEDILMKDLTETNRGALKASLGRLVNTLKSKGSINEIEKKRLSRLEEILNILNNGRDVNIMRKKLTEKRAEEEGLRDIDPKNKCSEFRYDKQICVRDHPKNPGLNCKWVSGDDKTYETLWGKVKDNQDIKRILKEEYPHIKPGPTSLHLHIMNKGYDCLDVKSNMFEDIGSVLQSRAAGGPGGSPGSAQSVGDTGSMVGQGGGRKKNKKTKKKKSKRKTKKKKSKKKKSKKKKSKKKKSKKKKSKKR